MLKVKNQSSKPYGVGVSNPGVHRRENSYPAYRAWQQMLQRCYCPSTKARQPSYGETTVCAEWLDYQTFADWYVQQRGYNLGWQLDKDLLSERLASSISIYSPETCILLPEAINKCLVVQKPKDTTLPVGAVRLRRANKDIFVAKCRDESGKKVHVGTYSTPEEAHSAYMVKKQIILNALADSYKTLLDLKALYKLNTYYKVV